MSGYFAGVIVCDISKPRTKQFLVGGNRSLFSQLYKLKVQPHFNSASTAVPCSLLLIAVFHILPSNRYAMTLKLGVLVPSSNTALEPLTSALIAQLSPAVSVHYSRFQVTEISLRPTALAQFSEVSPDSPIIAAARLLADAEVDVIGWSGTSGGWLGFDQDEALCRAITEATGGIPTTSSTLALNRALDLLAASKGLPKKFALVTPYLDDVQEMIVKNYAASGYEVVAEIHLRRTVNTEFASINEATLGAQVKEVVRKGREKGELLAVSTFCTNLSAAQHAEKWENEYGVMILDTVSTVVWDMLRIKGWERGAIKGWGGLFAL